MKLSSVTILVAASALFAACGSLDNPFTGWFHKKSDARVYNPQTGEWETPNQKTTPQPQKSAAVASTPGSQGGGGGRYFDAQKNQWVELHDPSSPAHPADPQATPAPAAPTATQPAAPVTSAAPRPARATGIYNSSTGKIEWQTSGADAPAPTPKPTPAKHWWWPF